MENLRQNYLDIYSIKGTHIIDEFFSHTKILETDFRIEYHKALFIYLKKFERNGYIVTENDINLNISLKDDNKLDRQPVNFKNVILNLKPCHFKHLFVISFIKNFAILKNKIELSYSSNWYPKNISILPINLIITNSESLWVEQINFYSIEKNFLNFFDDEANLSVPLLNKSSTFMKKLKILKEFYSKKGHVKCHYCSHTLKICNEWCVNKAFLIILLNYKDLIKFKHANEWLFDKNSNLIVQRVFFDNFNTTATIDELFDYENCSNLINSFKIYYLPQNGDLRNMQLLLNTVQKFQNKNEKAIPLAIRKKWIINIDEKFADRVNIVNTKKENNIKRNLKRKIELVSSYKMSTIDESLFNLLQYTLNIKNLDFLNSFYF